MTNVAPVEVAQPRFASQLELDPATMELLSRLFDDSLDCIKVIGQDGSVQFMNRNGLCAMELSDWSAVAGQQWPDLWPAEARESIRASLSGASKTPQRFDAYCPTAKGNPRWWDITVSPIEDPLGNSLGYLAISRDVTATRLAKEVAEVSAAEMRHRLQNSYAMVAGFLTTQARGQPEREEFVKEIKARLKALGVAQTMFLSCEHSRCELTELLPALLAPFAQPQCPIEITDLPQALIDQGQADALALVFGELAVNSSKHGALTCQGHIQVSASLVADELVIAWSERSSRLVEAHSRPEGQGLRLIRRILSYRAGSLELVWVPNGLDAFIKLRMTPTS